MDWIWRDKKGRIYRIWPPILCGDWETETILGYLSPLGLYDWIDTAAIGITRLPGGAGWGGGKIFSSMLTCWSCWKFLEAFSYLGLKLSGENCTREIHWRDNRRWVVPRLRELSDSPREKVCQGQSPWEDKANAKGRGRGTSKDTGWAWRREYWGERPGSKRS